MENIAKEIRNNVLENLRLLEFMDDAELRDYIETLYLQKQENAKASMTERKRCTADVFNGLRRMGIIEDLMEDKEITEILINGKDNIFYEKGGRLYQYGRSFESDDELEAFAQMMIGVNNRMVNASKPIADGRLKDGSRVNVVLAPVSVSGTTVTIRRFSENKMTMEKLKALGSLSEEIEQFLKDMVRAGYNIFISGGTGSGKTTFLNALSDFIPEDERVITIEDSAELQLKNVQNIVSLETRVAGAEGVEEISIRDLIRTSLRMRPDRIIVGECRGPEALDMLQALNTGHQGSMSTGHANSTQDSISRLEVMVATAGEKLPLDAIRGQIASGIDILVHLGRLRDKSRKVLEVTEITGIRDGEIEMNKLFEFVENGFEDGKVCGIWEKVGELKQKEKLKLAGLIRNTTS